MNVEIVSISSGAGALFRSFFVYAAVINLFAFAVFALDKWKSQNGHWRIPEKTLLTLALIGGSPALLLGQKYLRHKTQKQPFGRRLFAIILLQVVLSVLLISLNW